MDYDTRKRQKQQVVLAQCSFLTISTLTALTRLLNYKTFKIQDRKYEEHAKHEDKHCYH